MTEEVAGERCLWRSDLARLPQKASAVCVEIRGLSPGSASKCSCNSGQDPQSSEPFPRFCQLWGLHDHPDMPSSAPGRDGCAEARRGTGTTRGDAGVPGRRCRGPPAAHLWVLEEGVLVVDAAPAAVLPRVLVPRPGPAQPGLLPGLVDAQVRRVEQAALDDVSEVLAHVLEGHPGVARG